MLHVSNGRLLIDGVQCREVGWNAYYEFLKTLISNSDTSYTLSLAKLAEYKVKVIRCMVTPLWPGGTGGWATYDTATGMTAGFYSLLDAFMDECEANGIQVVMPLFWRHATLPDLFSETVNQIGTSGSAALTYAVTCAQEIVARYKTHAACGAWQVGNEWVPYAQNGTLPTANTGQGTPASYAAPNDAITEAQCKLAIKTISDAIRATDPDRAILGAASRPATAVPTSAPLLFDDVMALANTYNNGSVDVCGLHIYADGHYGNDGWYALPEYCCINRAVDRHKPVIVDEVGISEDFSGDLDASWAELKSLMAHPSAPELVLLWNWGNHTTYASGDTNWDVYPSVNREYQADAVRDVQEAKPGIALSEGREFVPTRFARFDGGATTPDCVYFAANEVTQTDSWMVTFWLRYRGPFTGSGTFWRLISFGDESTEGMMVLRHTDGRFYSQVTIGSGNVNTYNRSPVNNADRWMHHAIGWDNSTQKLRHVMNGRWTCSDAQHGASYVKGSGKKFVIGANQSLADGAKADVFDLRFYDQSLSLPDIWATSVNKDASVDPVFRVLHDGIDSSLTVQGSPTWVTPSQRAVVSSPRSTGARTLPEVRRVLFHQRVSA